MMLMLQGILAGIFLVSFFIGVGISVAFVFKMNKVVGIGTALLLFSYIGFSILKILEF